ncbi:MAG: hypothetical protein KKH83_07760 [Candidatus Margulisbacteria bacterium]|nr:hypothetical protein [Candidatus Margulisiibacteriota bacterium]
MKKLLLASFAVILIASMSSAVYLSPAITPQKGKWGVSLAWASTSNYGNYPDLKFDGMVASVKYDINDKVGLSFTYGQPNPNGSALTYTISGGGTYLGTRLTYNFLNEFDGKTPVSLAGFISGTMIGGSIDFKNSTTGVLPNMNSGASLSSYTGGVVVSKLISMFIPYAVISYGSNSLSLDNTAVVGALPGSSTALNMSIGTGIAFHEKVALFLEYESSSISTGGASYTSPTVGALIGIGLN